MIVAFSVIMMSQAIILSFMGIAMSGVAAENPLIGRGTLGVTNRGTLDAPADPRVGRGTLGVVSNPSPYATNPVPNLTNNLVGTNMPGVTNGPGLTNGSGGAARPLAPPGNPAVPSRPLQPGNPILPPPSNPTAPGSTPKP